MSRYGGFLGNAPGGGETERSQRDLESNKTILSGDIGTVDDPSDNSLHLVRASDVGPSAAINGFTVTRAYLDSGEVGGGLYILDANSVITRCLFEDNEVIGNAGAAPPDFRSTRV